MPITKTAKKALRQSGRRRIRNLRKQRAYKLAVRVFKRTLASEDPSRAKTLLPQTYQALDKAAKTNVISKNKANRLKSRLSKHTTPKA